MRKKRNKNIGIDSVDWFLLALGSFIVICFIIIGVLLIASYISPKETVVFTEELVSIEDATHPSGSFFLGSGTIDTEPVYVAYISTGDGFKQETYDADSTLIKYGENPHVEIECERSTWAWTRSSSSNRLSQCLKTTYTIIVPEGTIAQNYQLGPQE